MISFLIKILFLALVTPLAATEVASRDVSAHVAVLDQTIEQVIAANAMAGCAVAVVQDKKVIFEKFYGKRHASSGGRIDRHTVFQLGSVSKPLAATLVQILQYQNKLSIHDKLKQNFPFMHPHTELSHLLSHSSGYARSGWNQRIESSATREHLLQHLMQATQKHPGSEFDYHNYVYSLLEDCLQSKTRKSFALLVSEELFIPLGMRHASVGLEAYLRASNQAWSHEVVENSKSIRCLACAQPSHAYHHKVASAGGINASLSDLIPFVLLHLHGDDEILPFHEVQAMHKSRVQVLKHQVHYRFPKGTTNGYGHGWRIAKMPEGGTIVYHGGHLKGILNLVAFVPHLKLGIIILNNSDNPRPVKAGLEFIIQAMGYEPYRATQMRNKPHRFKKAMPRKAKTRKTKSHKKKSRH